VKEYISLDVHKRYTFAEKEDVVSGRIQHRRIEHNRGAIRSYLRGVEAGTPVAVEATGNWYWIVEEIDQAGCQPKLVHPHRAKVMMGCINKTDKLDVHGMNRLQRTGTLPTVWIAPPEIRDLRDLPRTRMFFSRERTRLKNRIQANLTKFGLNVVGFSDSFGAKARLQMEKHIEQLPYHTQTMTRELLRQLDLVEEQLDGQEKRIRELVKETPVMQLLRTIPGIGDILSVVVAMEIGDITRFSSAERLASYAGTTPRIHASGDKIRFGRLRSDVNRYLKWAFIEAANCIRLHARRYPDRHVVRLYGRIARRRGHQKATGALARHLAEAVFHVWQRSENYKEPNKKEGAQNQGNANATAA
jgi:transposase